MPVYHAHSARQNSVKNDRMIKGTFRFVLTEASFVLTQRFNML